MPTTQLRNWNPSQAESPEGKVQQLWMENIARLVTSSQERFAKASLGLNAGANGLDAEADWD